MGSFYLTGDGIEVRPEVAIVKRELGKIGIFLEGFSIKITGVYIKPRPYGFDFHCGKARELLALARRIAALNEDDRDTLEGKISAGATDGEGLRQIGIGPRLHLEISVSDGKCNAHIDSHGYVIGRGQYDYNRALEHGYWDLFADKLPWFFGAFGDRGQVGPMIRPMQGLDGKIRLIFGLTGHW